MKIALAVGALALLIGCSDADSDGPGAGASGSTSSGTSSANGGSSVTGGNNPASGGSVANGGSDSASGGSSANGGSPGAGGSSATGGSSANGGSPGAGGSNANGGNSGSGGSAMGGSSGSGGAGGGAGGGNVGGPWNAGNPNACKAGVPAEGLPAAITNPTTVVGTGTAASCTFALLSAAVTKGGIITFNCGTGAVTIPIAATLNAPTNKDTVIDGNRLVTLDGQGKVRILSFDSPGWQTNTHRLTLQHIALINAKATPTIAIPVAPAPCSQGWNDGAGGGVYMRDGNLTVIDSIFTGNKAAPLGPDTGGGAIYVQGSMHGLVIVGSTFTQNAAANAGAVGGLFCEHHIYNSLFSQNTAIGNGANSDDATACPSAMNNGQHEVGSGGNGGAIYSDGINVNIMLCGDKILNNAAGMGAFGGGLFFTSNNMAGTLSITDTTMTGNTGGHWTNVSMGTITNAGSAVGTNCKSITVANSTLQP
jgi:hypothetical protein